MLIVIYVIYHRPYIISRFCSVAYKGGRRSPAVAGWASDHWVDGSNPRRGKFRH